MSVEIRQIRDEEWEEYVFVNAYAFNAPRTAEALQEAVALNRAVYAPEWLLAAFVDGRLVAGLRVLPFAMRINGAAVSMGGVGGVACLPEHRRKGYVGALLRRSLEDMRDRGQAISGLYTPHHSLYRRYGWEIASRAIRYSFAPKDIRLLRPPAAERCRRVNPDEWQALDGIYQEYARERNGPLVRNEVWWREAVLGGKREPSDAALWENSDGQGRGYVVYRNRRFDRPERKYGEDILQVRELIALDGDAYAGLISYLANHDVNDHIEWSASPDEPFLHVVSEPFRVYMRRSPALMLRLVDMPRALEARPCLDQTSGRRLTLAVKDSSAPWNEGVWRLEAAEGRISAQAASEQADLTMDVRTLAALYNGFLAPVEAARAGLIDVERPSALADAAAIFSVSYAPFCLDYF